MSSIEKPKCVETNSVDKEDYPGFEANGQPISGGANPSKQDRSNAAVGLLEIPVISFKRLIFAAGLCNMLKLGSFYG